MVKLNNDNINLFFGVYAAQAAEVVTADDPVSDVYGIASFDVADSGAWYAIFGKDGTNVGNVWASSSASGGFTVDVTKPVLSEIRNDVGKIIFSGSTSSWQGDGLTEKSHTGIFTVKQLSAQDALDAGFLDVAIEKAIKGFA